VSTRACNDPVHDWPLWWFARLEAAILRGDYRVAHRAQQELKRLGVTVQYRGRRPVAERAEREVPCER
jgi:hypothetical protein